MEKEELERGKQKRGESEGTEGGKDLEYTKVKIEKRRKLKIFTRKEEGVY